jgi:DNA-binding response OmpR family regulator
MGATDYLTKPFDVDILLKRVQKRIKSGKLLREIIEEGKDSVALKEILAVDLINSLKTHRIDCKLMIDSPLGKGKIEIKKGKIKKSTFDDTEDKNALSRIAGLKQGKIQIER